MSKHTKGGSGSQLSICTSVSYSSSGEAESVAYDTAKRAKSSKPSPGSSCFRAVRCSRADDKTHLL